MNFLIKSIPFSSTSLVLLYSRRTYSNPYGRFYSSHYKKNPRNYSSDPARGRLNRLLKKKRKDKQRNFAARQNVPAATRRTRNDLTDSAEYVARQAEYSKFITIFGRKTILDALQDQSMHFHHIHIDEKLLDLHNKDAVLTNILELIKNRSITLIPVTRARIGIISKCGKQDGGIVADILSPTQTKFDSVQHFLQKYAQNQASYRILALDQVTTPSNVGMVIRSAVASGTIDAIVLGPGSASELNPLVIKASGGTALMAARHAPSPEENSQYKKLCFIHTSVPIHSALQTFKKDGAEVALLTTQKHILKIPTDSVPSPIPSHSLWDYQPHSKCVFVIGGESSGHDPTVIQIATRKIYVPMAPGVESLNCAVAASLVAFSPFLRRQSSI